MRGKNYCFIPHPALSLFRSYHVCAHCSASDRLHASSPQSEEEEQEGNRFVCSWAPHLHCDKLKHLLSIYYACIFSKMDCASVLNTSFKYVNKASSFTSMFVTLRNDALVGIIKQTFLFLIARHVNVNHLLSNKFANLTTTHFLQVTTSCWLFKVFVHQLDYSLNKCQKTVKMSVKGNIPKWFVLPKQ